MVKIEVTEEELQIIISLIEGSSVQIAHAENALKLLRKFKDAKGLAKDIRPR
jgi:hypothetical protein